MLLLTVFACGGDPTAQEGANASAKAPHIRELVVEFNAGCYPGSSTSSPATYFADALQARRMVDGGIAVALNSGASCSYGSCSADSELVLTHYVDYGAGFAASDTEYLRWSQHLVPKAWDMQTEPNGNSALVAVGGGHPAAVVRIAQGDISEPMFIPTSSDAENPRIVLTPSASGTYVATLGASDSDAELYHLDDGADTVILLGTLSTGPGELGDAMVHNGQLVIATRSPSDALSLFTFDETNLSLLVAGDLGTGGVASPRLIQPEAPDTNTIEVLTAQNGETLLIRYHLVADTRTTTFTGLPEFDPNGEVQRDPRSGVISARPSADGIALGPMTITDRFAFRLHGDPVVVSDFAGNGTALGYVGFETDVYAADCEYRYPVLRTTTIRGADLSL